MFVHNSENKSLGQVIGTPTEAFVQVCSIEKVFSKISQISQETFLMKSFLRRVAGRLSPPLKTILSGSWFP